MNNISFNTISSSEDFSSDGNRLIAEVEKPSDRNSSIKRKYPDLASLAYQIPPSPTSNGEIALNTKRKIQHYPSGQSICPQPKTNQTIFFPHAGNQSQDQETSYPDLLSCGLILSKKNNVLPFRNQSSQSTSSVIRPPLTLTPNSQAAKLRYGKFKSFVLDELLKPHQKIALKRVKAQKRLLLAYGMGLGKTRLALALVLLTMAEKMLVPNTQTKNFRPFEPFLIVVPPSLFDSWKNEIEKVNQALVKHGDTEFLLKSTIFSQKNLKPASPWVNTYRETHIVLFSYSLLKDKYIDALCQDSRNRLKYGGLILDESHHIKHEFTITSEKALSLRKKSTPTYTLLLSGTPVENDFNELVGQLRILAPRKFNDAWKDKFEEFIANPIRNFLKTFPKGQTLSEINSIREEISQNLKCPDREDNLDNDLCDETDETNCIEADLITSTEKEVGKAFSYLLSVVDSYILRKSIDDPDMQEYFPNIPRPNHSIVSWKMHPFQKYFYERSAQAYSKLSIQDQNFNKLTFIQEIRTLCNLPCKDKVLSQALCQLVPGHSGIINNKLLALVDCVNQLLIDQFNRVIVFVHNVDAGNEIANKLGEALNGRVSFVCGQDSPKEKNSKIEGAQQGLEIFNRVLILSQGVGSEGLCLHQFNHIISFDLPWSPSQWQQQIGRAHRFGQERQVHVHNMVNIDDDLTFSLDRYFKELFEKKEKMIRSIFSGREGVLSMILPEVEHSNIDDVALKNRSLDLFAKELAADDFEEEEEEEPLKTDPKKRSLAVSEVIDFAHLRKILTESQQASIGISEGGQSCALITALDNVRDQFPYQTTSSLPLKKKSNPILKRTAASEDATAHIVDLNADSSNCDSLQNKVEGTQKIFTPQFYEQLPEDHITINQFHVLHKRLIDEINEGNDEALYLYTDLFLYHYSPTLPNYRLDPAMKEAIAIEYSNKMMQAKENLLIAASHHHPEACYKLAKMFEEGKGIPQSKESAIIFYKEAFKNKYFLASYHLAVLHESHSKDLDKAKFFFKKAYKKLHLPQALYKYGMICLQLGEDEAAENALLKASSDGHPEAAYQMGMRFHRKFLEQKDVFLHFSSAEQYFKSALINAGLCEESPEGLLPIDKRTKATTDDVDFSLYNLQSIIIKNRNRGIYDMLIEYHLFLKERELAALENQILNDYSIDPAIALAKLYKDAGNEIKFQYYTDLADRLSHPV